ncbi:HNH endonuclease signature motif containing protein [Nocardioides cynanchi]|uniref:HNH endonuclease signature motif containing protein n=1 Tax=Nocardioides cynanchi TaxID=2558918 RepID=UPI001245C7FE|nr:HNH endonuclease signature motif containing protein [Nocardioides cynanchi]
MLTHAARLDATDLARTGRHLVEVVDPDAADRRLEAALEREERAAHLGRFLAITEDRAGGMRIKGYGSVEDGAVLRAALLPLTAPTPACAGAVDDTGQPCGDQQDPRDHGARLWDALVQTAQHALDTALPPETHGTRPRLIVTLDHQTLKTQLEAHGVATTADGLDLPAAVVRRLACDADLIPAVLGGRGEVLDVGRTRRLVTAVIWIALVLRDRHCTFPGCHRPPLMCHAHHIHHWLTGGKTSLSNLALLCGHHHRVIHHTPWRIRLDPVDQRPEFLPPPKPGITPAWIRYRPRKE